MIDLAERLPSSSVVLFSPHFTEHPRFHVERYIWSADEDLTALERELLRRMRMRHDVPEGFRSGFTATHCGTVLRATWWHEPRDLGPADLQGTYEHPSSVVHLRLDQAASFATPCLRCFRTNTPLT